MTTTHAFLARGLFPAELPPPFRTDIFASAVVGNLSTLPTTFVSQQPSPAASHNLARYGALRRRLQVPNPVSFFPLARLLGTNWSTIYSHVSHSPLSLSIPKYGPIAGRSVVAHPGWDARLTKRLELRARGKFVLRTDISRFYPSLYTHSIAWAVHGKAYARQRRRSPGLFGNQLDEASRKVQDGQSIGLPIGPDTSFVLAELVLQAVDKDISRRIPSRNGFRVSDDFEFTFTTYGEAERARAVIQESLEKFALSLNAQKTIIFELPDRMEDEWASRLRSHEFRTSTAAAQRADIIDYFDSAFALLRDHPDTHILRYTVARLPNGSIRPANWSYAEQLLLQALQIDSGTITYVLRKLILASSNGLPINLTAVGDALNAVISHHAPLGHGSEVSWAIWGCMALGIPLDTNAAQAASASSDSFVALLALDARSRGLVPTGLNVASWQSLMNTAELYSEHWLLAYEAAVKGWLPGTAGTGHIAADPNFAWLHARGVEFYDPGRVIGAVPTTAAPSKGLGPLFSFP